MSAKPVIRIYAVLTLLTALLHSAPVLADGLIYQYKQKGVHVFTDRLPERGIQYEISKYGRPTAVASCTGLTPQALEKRASTYAPLISRHAAEHGVPAKLVRAVIRVESCFDQRAVSRVGARGLMQLMPGTASDLGVKDSFNPDQNIGGGVRYLSMMLQRFKQNRQLALAAYNAGPEAVAKYKGIPPYTETRNYVKKVLEAYGSDPRA